jgi:hypothetical protein
MITGLCFVLLGLSILMYPQLLVYMIAALFITFGLGIMLAAYQFRRVKRETSSRFASWIARY